MFIIVCLVTLDVFCITSDFVLCSHLLVLFSHLLQINISKVNTTQKFEFIIEYCWDPTMTFTHVCSAVSVIATRQSEMTNTSPRHMPVLGNVLIFFRDVISLLARVFMLLIDTATQEVPMKNI